MEVCSLLSAIRANIITEKMVPASEILNILPPMAAESFRDGFLQSLAHVGTDPLILVPGRT